MDFSQRKEDIEKKVAIEAYAAAAVAQEIADQRLNRSHDDTLGD